MVGRIHLINHWVMLQLKCTCSTFITFFRQLVFYDIIYLFIYLFIYSFIYLLIYLFIYLFILTLLYVGKNIR